MWKSIELMLTKETKKNIYVPTDFKMREAEAQKY